MQKYCNKGTHDGAQNIIISAEKVTDGEHAGLWHVVDKNSNEGYITEEQFQDNWTPVNQNGK